MNAITPTTSHALQLPEPRVKLSTRLATMSDLPFLDALQKKHRKALGYFPTKQFEGYIEMGGVLIAEAVGSGQLAAGSGENAVGSRQLAAGSEEGPHSLPTANRQPPTPLGYCISRDRYLKRDELGVIFQLCVSDGVQRKLIGASLIQSVFERSAYGCRLYGCWCAQDLPANRFWESLGFVPIAFRAGSAKKKRVHIFWMKRINEGDATTRYWYPFQTNAGAMRGDRLVFPIPPGTHWSEVTAVALPTEPINDGTPARLPAPRTRKAAVDPKTTIATKQTVVSSGGLRGYATVIVEATRSKKPKRPKPAVAKLDAKYLSAARELRDRYLEQVNVQALIGPGGKYEVSRAIATERSASPLLDAA